MCILECFRAGRLLDIALPSNWRKCPFRATRSPEGSSSQRLQEGGARAEGHLLCAQGNKKSSHHPHLASSYLTCPEPSLPFGPCSFTLCVQYIKRQSKDFAGECMQTRILTLYQGQSIGQLAKRVDPLGPPYLTTTLQVQELGRYPSDEPGYRAISSASRRQPIVPSAHGRSCSEANLFIPSCSILILGNPPGYKFLQVVLPFHTRISPRIPTMDAESSDCAVRAP